MKQAISPQGSWTLSLSVPSTRAYAMKLRTACQARETNKAFSTLNSGLRDETVFALFHDATWNAFSTLNSGLRDETGL